LLRISLARRRARKADRRQPGLLSQATTEFDDIRRRSFKGCAGFILSDSILKHACKNTLDEFLDAFTVAGV